MSIKTWKERITTPLTNQQNLFASMQAEIDELRAALQERELELAQITCLLSKNEDFEKTIAERDAEIANLHAAMTGLQDMESSAQQKLAAQRRVLEQALEALNNSTSIIFKDASKAHLRNAAITAIQGVLNAN